MGSLTFIQLRTFSADWDRLALSDDDLQRLENELAARPQDFPVVSGTGGLRKARLASPTRGKGKRGAFRVCYVYFEGPEVVLLVAVYAKAEKADLSQAGKKRIRELIEAQRRLLASNQK